MVCRTRLTQVQSSVLETPVQSVGTESAPAVFPANGTQANGSATAVDEFGYFPSYLLGVRNSAKFYNLVDAFGNRLIQGVSEDDETFPHAAQKYRNLVRYCEYPGNRLFQDVKFDVNGNPLDEYDDLVPVFLTKFCLPFDKSTGFKRLVGQEVPLEGYGTLAVCPVVDADAANTPSNINLAQQGHGFALFNNIPPGAFGNASGASAAATDYLAAFTPTTGNKETPSFTAPPLHWGAPAAGHPVAAFGNFGTVPLLGFAALNSTPGPVVDIHRELKAIVDGPQTPKPAQPPLEVWNKLR